MDPFLGKTYVMVSSENFEEYLKHIGVGYLQRKIVSSLKPSHRLSQNDDGTYNYEFLSTFRNSSIKFTPGVEFEETKPDNTKVKATITFEGNKMTHIQKELNGVTSTHVREFFPDKLIMTTTATGLNVVATRTYELVK